MLTVKQECEDCGATGLYRGMCEGEGEAVVCIRCEGRGWIFHTYKPFTYRKRRNNIKTIRLSRGSFIATGVGSYGEPMTYAQFQMKFPVCGEPMTYAPFKTHFPVD